MLPDPPCLAFVIQLDLTKTSDGKASFLNVLADTVYAKFPHDLCFADELPTVPGAAKCKKQIQQKATDAALSITDCTLSRSWLSQGRHDCVCVLRLFCTSPQHHQKQRQINLSRGQLRLILFGHLNWCGEGGVRGKWGRGTCYICPPLLGRVSTMRSMPSYSNSLSEQLFVSVTCLLECSYICVHYIHDL